MSATLSEEQFLELCDACDRVLLHPQAGIECQAIPWLHVIREHPVFLRNYQGLFEPVTQPASAPGWLQRHVVKHLLLPRQCYRALAGGGRHWFASAPPEGVDVLFVSHLVNAGHAGSSDDFYFFDAPRQLRERGVTPAIALLNHTTEGGALLAAKWSAQDMPRAVLSRSLGFGEEYRLRARMLAESKRLRGLAAAQPKGVYRKVLERAAQEAQSSSAWASLRMAEQFSSLVKAFRPRVVVTTYEGHPWERLAFAAARSVDPRITCVGYQHAALFRLQHAARRNLARPYNPDHILTSGTVAKRQLEHSPLLAGVEFAVLGSGRAHPGPAEDGMPAASSAACLVLPEGDVNECNFMFEFSIKCALALPQVTFVWRLHPLLSHEELAEKNPLLRNLPENIILSRETLAADLACCSTALYRGTTAIIQAIAAGLHPLYLAREGEMTIDPLHDCGAWRATVRTVEEFSRVASNHAWSAESALLARRYCESFFTSLDIEPLHDLITHAKRDCRGEH